MDVINDRISIILPVYNREAFVNECINSAFAQSYPQIEIVIVDDGSTDNTYALCQAIAEKDSRVKLLATEHVGVSAARNIALDNASGEYVFFLDSDDVIHPFLLETLVTGMRNSHAAIGATDVRNASAAIWHKVQQKLAETTNTGEIVSLTAEDVLRVALGDDRSPLAAVGGKLTPLSCIGGVMMRRDLIGDTRFRTDLYIGEDFYFIYENVLKGTAGVFLKQRWYYVRIHPHNSSWDYSFNGFWTRFYRRKLVWESEAALGRTVYADKQKQGAFDCAIKCLSKGDPYSEDGNQIREVLKTYKQDLYPVVSLKRKLLYLLYLYWPKAATILLKFKKR